MHLAQCWAYKKQAINVNCSYFFPCPQWLQVNIMQTLKTRSTRYITVPYLFPLSTVACSYRGWSGEGTLHMVLQYTLVTSLNLTLTEYISSQDGPWSPPSCASLYVLYLSTSCLPLLPPQVFTVYQLIAKLPTAIPALLPSRYGIKTFILIKPHFQPPDPTFLCTFNLT